MNNVLLFVLSCQLLQQMFVFAQNDDECGCVFGTICPNGTTGGIDIRVVTPDTSCPTGYTYCCVIDDDDDDNSIPCGLRRIQSQSPGPGLAAYGAYPWMVAILTIQGSYVGGGVLISSTRVLTVAHKVIEYDNSDIIARLGEWSFESENEPTVDIGISQISVISTFKPQNRNLHNDIAVLSLSSPAPIASNLNINTACLSSTSVTPGTKCWMSGWGEDAFYNGQLQTTLKQVDLPVRSKANCQRALRRTRLGSNFVLDDSFMCAGGEGNKDACTGDGGSPLVCPTSTGQYIVVGLVSWGIGCGDARVPGVYTDVSHFYNWIMKFL